MLSYLTIYLKITYNVLSISFKDRGVAISPLASCNFIGTVLIFNNRYNQSREKNGKAWRPCFFIFIFFYLQYEHQPYL